MQSEIIAPKEKRKKPLECIHLRSIPKKSVFRIAKFSRKQVVLVLSADYKGDKPPLKLAI